MFWLSAGGGGVGWVVYGRHHAIPVPSASQRAPQDCAGSPRPTLPLLFSGKRAYPQRGRSLSLFLSNSSGSPENSVLCKTVAGYWQQGDYHYFRGTVLMSSVLFGTGPGTSSHTSWLKTYVNWQRGLSCVNCLFPLAPCYGIIHYHHEIIGHSHSTLSNKGFFHSGELWFSRGFIY